MPTWFETNGFEPQVEPQVQAQQPAPAQTYDRAALSQAIQGLQFGGTSVDQNTQYNPADFIAQNQGGFAQGVQMVGSDKIRLPDGEIVDIGGDIGAGGQGKAWWGSERDWDAANPGARAAQAAAPQGGGGGGSPWAGTGGSGSSSGGMSGSMAMPTAPAVTDLQAPAPFSYAPSTLGQFAAPSSTPTPERLSYQNATAPQSLTAQQVGQPASLSYTAMQTPTAFAGSRQADPRALSYENLATPAGYQAEKYQGLSAEQLAADPSYQFRFKQGQGAAENILAHSGALRTGNAAKALTDYGQQAASQEYAAADQRARSTNQMNNATSLGAYQTNAQTGLAYNQNANQNAMQFGQQNIQNQQQANEQNYGRAANEAQQGFQNAFATNQANNAGQLQAGQANISNQLNATQANNAANLGFGAQNFNQGFAVNQANNQGQQAATQANNANALAAQGQQFGQALGGYQANQVAQNQGYNQALGAYGQNAQTGLAYGSQNQQNQLANYQAQTNAALGLGNLNLGFQNSAQNYALGQGGLGVQQGQLGLQQGEQDFYQNTLTPWNQNYQIASLGNPGAPSSQGNANSQSDLYTQQGNSQAAGDCRRGESVEQHGGELRPDRPTGRLSSMASESAENNVMALCGCGCGQPTNIVTQTNAARGISRGDSRQFIKGHGTRVVARVSYKLKGQHGHARRVHIIRAESAIGKTLPKGTRSPSR